MRLSREQIVGMSDEEAAAHNRREMARLREWERRNAIGHVYFLRGGNTVKIGFSKNVSRRLEKLRNGNPESVFICKVVEGPISKEKAYHKRFAEYRVRGEWFELRGRLAKYLERDVFPISLPKSVAESRPDVQFIL